MLENTANADPALNTLWHTPAKRPASSARNADDGRGVLLYITRLAPCKSGLTAPPWRLLRP